MLSIPSSPPTSFPHSKSLLGLGFSESYLQQHSLQYPAVVSSTGKHFWNLLVEIVDFEKQLFYGYHLAHTLQVTSIGGVGSTELLNHLRYHIGEKLEYVYQWGDGKIFKHQFVPPDQADVPDSFRALFLCGDPRDAILSVFRQGFQTSLYQLTNDLRAWLDSNKLDPKRQAVLEDIGSYVQNGVDIFRTAEHINNWLQPAGYPVMVMKYEALGTKEGWEAIRDFFCLPKSAQPFPWRQRESDWTKQSKEIQRGLTAIYAEAIELVESLSNFLIVPDRVPAVDVRPKRVLM